MFNVPVVLQEDQDISSIQSDFEIKMESVDANSEIEFASSPIDDKVFVDEVEDLNPSNHEDEMDLMFVT